ncbi:MAG TPA: hypothetical protein VFA65_24360 [Bryobacteraceae bacterium]|nr:hypothetical protein [Bryobacteraceae bacterium]
MVRVHILLGGLFGPDGAVTSRGMYGLADSLSKLPNVTCQTYFWSSWQVAWQAMWQQKPTEKTAVIGYSGGGSRATWLADFSKLNIELMVLYDPSPEWQMCQIGNNVARAICYYNQSPMMFGLGGGKLTAINGFKGYLETVPIAEQHLAVQYDSTLHARTIAEVKQL